MDNRAQSYKEIGNSQVFYLFILKAYGTLHQDINQSQDRDRHPLAGAQD